MLPGIKLVDNMSISNLVADSYARSASAKECNCKSRRW